MPKKKKKKTETSEKRKKPSKEFSLKPKSKLSYFLVFILVSIMLHFGGGSDILVFITAAIAIIPLAGLMGRATEELALHTNPTVGGFLNATFGNATELIIALVAIKEAAADPAHREALFMIVKASITGSIIGNILLVFGLSMLLGGLKFKVQKFNIRSAQMSSSIMTLAVIALLIPSMWVWFPTFAQDINNPDVQQNVSNALAVVMMFIYFLSLFFSLKTHKDLLNPTRDEHKKAHEKPTWSKGFAMVILIGTTVMVALMSELLVGSIEGATHTLGLTELFVGIIIIAIVGNAAEHSTAILMAMKDKMDISLTIAAGSSTQIALLITPILVFASILFGAPMNLVFFPFEVVAIGISVVILNMVSLDGESNWFEGCQLLGVYLILAIMFYFHPPV
jgi:Ca2+:H+ antiporter